MLFVINKDMFQGNEWDTIKKLGFLYLLIDFPQFTADIPLVVEFSVAGRVKVPMDTMIATLVSPTIENLKVLLEL